MTLCEFAQTIIADPTYRESVVARARAGTLPPDVELLLLELADGRHPVSIDRPPLQSKTLALVRPSASTPISEEIPR